VNPIPIARRHASLICHSATRQKLERAKLTTNKKLSDANEKLKEAVTNDIMTVHKNLKSYDSSYYDVNDYCWTVR